MASSQHQYQAHHARESTYVVLARKYGWRAYAVPVLVIITLWVIVDTFVKPANQSEDAAPTASQQATSDALTAETGEAGPVPAEQAKLALGIGDLPAGAAYTEKGSGTVHTVGSHGASAGKGTEKVIRYVVEVEDGVDTSVSGGDDAFAAMVDATLTNPKSWTHDPRFRFEHVSDDEDPNLRIQLSSTERAHTLCGNQLKLETSCFTSDGDRVVINHARWVRGATPFQGDVGSYRQYAINHEVGHGIGYASHEPCSGDGDLAPVMMQQTLGLNNAELHKLNPKEVYPDQNATCRFNPWPYPKAE